MWCVLYGGALILGPTILIAAFAMWRWPRFWWPSLGALTTAAVILLYLPIRSALHEPIGIDPVGDGFSIPTEFFGV